MGSLNICNLHTVKTEKGKEREREGENDCVSLQQKKNAVVWLRYYIRAFQKKNQLNSNNFDCVYLN